MNRTRRILEVIVILILAISSCDGSGGDIPLRCDEYDSMGYMDVNEAFCTVTGFTVTHSQNVVIKNIPPGNMVKFMKHPQTLS